MIQARPTPLLWVGNPMPQTFFPERFLTTAALRAASMVVPVIRNNKYEKCEINAGLRAANIILPLVDSFSDAANSTVTFKSGMVNPAITRSITDSPQLAASFKAGNLIAPYHNIPIHEQEKTSVYLKASS